MIYQPYKIRQTVAHSEDVYYDENGDEIARVIVYDDWIEAASGPISVSDEELEDYYGSHSTT